MKHSITQQSFLQPDPLPIVVSIKYDFPLAYHKHDGAMWYSVRDWIAGMTGEEDTQLVTRLWNNFKKQTSFSKVPLKLPYVASDGKTYQRNFVTDETLYKFAAYARSMKDRPQIAEIKDFLAKAGVFVDKIRVEGESVPQLPSKDRKLIAAKIDQGMTTQEAQEFLVLVQDGHVARRQWTDVLRTVVHGVIYYGSITDAQYLVLYGVRAKDITEITGFKPARDGMTMLGRQITNACDIALMDEFKRHENLTFNQAQEIAKEVCADFSPTIKRIQQRTGVNLATGQRLIGGGE